MVRLKISGVVCLAGSFMFSGSSFKIHFQRDIVYAPIEKAIVGRNNIIQ